MTLAHVVGLISKQLQIINAVVAWVFVNVVNYFLGLKISSEMLFHDEAMLKHVFQSRLFGIRGIRMVIRNNNHDIPILTDSFAPRPSWCKFLSFPIHRIISALQSFPIHRIVRSSYISVVGWIGVGQVASCNSTTDRAIFPVWSASVLIERPAALHALYLSSAPFCYTGASLRAVFKMSSMVRAVFSSALLTISVNHSHRLLLYGV